MLIAKLENKIHIITTYLEELGGKEQKNTKIYIIFQFSTVFLSFSS